jgi:hypothetical protein
MSRSTAADSVGSLLAEIANFLVDGVRILSLSDKRHWGPDEHEQLRALEDALDEAKKDFQGLAPLVNGQSHYENDRSRTLASLPYSPTQPPFRPLLILLAKTLIRGPYRMRKDGPEG